MNTIKQTSLINAAPQQVWQALTDQEIIEVWSGAETEFVPEPEAEYSLWDGSICGVIVSVEPNKKLVQTWKPDNWTIENSVVSFTLMPDGDGTRVELLHENVEDFDFEGTEEGWDLYYLGAIKRMLEAKPKPRNTKSAKEKKTAKRSQAAGKTKAQKATKPANKGKVTKKSKAAKNTNAAKATSKKKPVKKVTRKRTKA
jgi:uncharacterized protein YndB with AHSA1/START domain